MNISIVNAVSNSPILMNISIKLRYWDSDYDDPLGPSESVLDIPYLDIPPLGTENITHSFTGISKSYSAYWKLWYKNEGTYAHNETVVVED